MLAGREMALQVLQGYGKGEDRYSLIHADTLPENFLVDAGGAVHVIDFDDGGYGWHLFDFAAALLHVLGNDCFDDLMHALVKGYQEVCSLPPEFEKMLPLFFLLRGFTYLGWVHTRKEAVSAKELGSLIVGVVMGLLDRL